jgi:hypothetical protein
LELQYSVILNDERTSFNEKLRVERSELDTLIGELSRKRPFGGNDVGLVPKEKLKLKTTLEEVTRTNEEEKQKEAKHT